MGRGARYHGAPAHTAKSVTEWLKKNGIKVPDYPARSPDLNPLDYGIWGTLADRVNRAKPESEIELRCAIRKAARSLTAAEVRNTVMQFEKRLEM